jgi:hypothetical protein
MLSFCSIFDDIKMKAMVQSLRFLVFKIIDILMAKHREGQSHTLLEDRLGRYCGMVDI